VQVCQLGCTKKSCTTRTLKWYRGVINNLEI
jgi:hypothetical protein